MQLDNKAIKLLNGLCVFCGKIANYLALALIVITITQVTTRYVFQYSFASLEELKWHFFGALFLLGMAYTYQGEGHVRVDIFYQNYSTEKKAYVELFMCFLIIVPVCLLVIWHGINYAIASYKYSSAVALNKTTNVLFAFLVDTGGAWIYHFCAAIEWFIRSFIIRGEMSPNHGGLPARYLIKLFIPFGFFLLMVQSVLLALTRAMPAISLFNKKK